MEKEYISKRYREWIKQLDGTSFYDELSRMDEKQIEDSFYKELAFGTGGIRGVMGIGTAKINEFVIARATQGLANYMIHKKLRVGLKKVVIGYDTRNNSEKYAKIAANVLMNNGIKTYLFSEALPTPCISFAVRELECFLGIVITASHNPSEYNGYKVYEKKGCQITNEMADQIYDEIKKVGYFDIDITNQGNQYNFVNETIYDSYIQSVLKQSISSDHNADVKIVYSPLNGTGLKPVTQVLKLAGFDQVILVEEQKNPDGNFPTCKKPNPEEIEAMQLGIEYAKNEQADLVLATDPDCDRVSIAVKNKDDFRILSANELGCLLLDFICSNVKIQFDDVFMKTIVTTDLAELIAQNYGLRTINTLTGFKYIGEQIGLLEKKHKETSFVFGFEESCGFLRGTYVRDKDATVASLLICEMYAAYQSQGITLMDKLNEIYNKYGFCLNTQHSFKFDGASGSEKMNQIMDYVRYKVQTLGGYNVVLKKDYLPGIDNLPKSNVVKLFLDNNSSVIFRPSGTEPKLKVYFSIFGEEKSTCQTIEHKMVRWLTGITDSVLKD